MPATRKKVCAATHMQTASAAELNATWRAGMRRISENTHPPSAIASVAGPGPKSNAVVMKNVSSIAMFADSNAKFNRNDPATIASAPSATHRIGYGVRRASNAASTNTSAPISTTACR